MSPSTAPSLQGLPSSGASPSRPHAGPAWLRRFLYWFWRLLYLLFCLEVGVFLLVLPWLGFWENNYLLYKCPAMRPIVANPFLKGGVFGLGIVNILIGIQEIAHFRRGSKGCLSG